MNFCILSLNVYFYICNTKVYAIMDKANISPKIKPGAFVTEISTGIIFQVCFSLGNEGDRNVLLMRAFPEYSDPEEVTDFDAKIHESIFFERFKLMPRVDEYEIAREIYGRA